MSSSKFTWFQNFDSECWNLIGRGYMAPEYALWGHLTYKADVYSFGVVALEIVTGKNNNSFVPTNNTVCLLDWV